MLLRAVVGGMLVASVAFAGAPPGIDAPIAEVMAELRRIESAAWHGTIDVTRIDLQNRAKERPNDPMLRVYVAWCSMPTDDAWNQLKNVSQIFPDVAWVHYGMGRIYVGWKMRDLAKTSLELAMKKVPNFYPALVALGDMARQRDELDEAETRYREALAIADDAEAHAGLGLVLAKKGDAASARAALSKAVSLWPDQPAALRALVTLQSPADADYAKHLGALADLQPKDRDARRLVAALKFDSGDRAGAIADYEKLLRLGNPDLETVTRLQKIYRDQANIEGEERVTTIMAGLEKESPAPLVRLAELKQQKGDVEGAEKLLLEAIERNRELADTWYRLGALSMARQQPVIALDRFRRGRSKSTSRADECRSEAAKLEESFKLPAKPAKGSVDRISVSVSKSLEDFYWVRRKTNPKLRGTLKVRVKVTAEGVVENSEVVEDSVGDALLAGHAVFALRDAEFEQRRREPVFEFELGTPAKKGK